MKLYKVLFDEIKKISRILSTPAYALLLADAGGLGL